MEEFYNIPTTCISDAMKGLNNMEQNIKPLIENHKVVGKAFTVKMVPGDNLIVLKAINDAEPDDVIVIDTKEDSHHAVAGDFIIGMAKAVGLSGIVTNGVIRDIQGVKSLDYPVFCKGSTVAASNKYGRGEVNVPINCGGVSIHPGDIIVGDADGVTVIPKGNKKTILSKAKEKLKQDEERDKSVSDDEKLIKDYITSTLEKHRSIT